VKAGILAAGFGTRMAQLGQDRPKALLKVGGRAALDWIVLALGAIEDVSEIDLITNAKFLEQFEAWKEREERPLPIRILNDGAMDNESRRGAIGDFLWYFEQACEGASPEEMLLLASDNLWCDDLGAIVERFRGKGRSGCLLRREAPEQLHRRGVARVDGEGRLIELIEKPNDPPSSWVVPPIYYLRREAIEAARRYPTGERSRDAIGHLLAWLCEQVPIVTERLEGPWLDIGNLETYHQGRETFRPFGWTSGEK